MRKFIMCKSIMQIVGMILTGVVIFAGCAEQTETLKPVDPVTPSEPVTPQDDDHIELAFACSPLSANSVAKTRLTDDVLQQDGTYRSISTFRFITLIKDTETGSIESIPVAEVDHPQASEIKTGGEKFYHFSYCNMEKGVNACLVYAKADKSLISNTKAYNGSLIPEIPSRMTSLSQVSFSPESILDATEAREEGGDTWEQEAWELADALTDIAKVEKWKTSTNIILKNLYNNYTNHEANLPGSAASVKKWIAALESAVDGYLDEPPSGLNDLEISILTAIKTQIGATSISDGNTYPRDINLPDGAAALRWTGEKFEPRLQTTTLDDINSVSRFVYPPALFYFVDSPIKTSDDKVEFSTYRNDFSWDNVLNRFDKLAVGINTQTVAIKNPLQYAVAQLSMQLKAAEDNLPYIDKTDLTKTVPISALSLKGLIIGGQRPVGYDFKPINNSDVDVRFVYDSQVNPSFTKEGTTSNTLVLESYGGKNENDGEDVNIILEFEYTGAEEFKCLNGYVYPNTRFYLVGEVKLSTGIPSTGVAEEDRADVIKRVFTQDRITEIQVTVSSLEKAYNVLPSILSKNLEVGVETTPKWLIATPSDPIRMD